jgi:hypothetical protein
VNYGHELQSGVLLNTHRSDPTLQTRIAQTAEAAGCDVLVLVNDSAQSDSSDIWTQATWIAGVSGRIEITAMVGDLPLRLPAVLARSAISLDLLSAGRVSIGLTDQALPADGVAAVVDILRGMADLSGRRAITNQGSYFPLRGAKRGPIPTRDIPVWLNASSPEMLRLTGQHADVWFAPFQNMRADDVGIANQVIDEAATEAGRDPREIRRALVIEGTFADCDTGFLQADAAAWVEDLLPYVTDHGVSLFLLDSSDRHTIETFSRSVLPLLQERVRAVLPDWTPVEPPRRADVRAKRKADIDYAAVPDSLRSTLVEPGDVTYPRVRSTYLRGGAPGIVLRPGSAEEVVDAVAYARRHRTVPLSIRSAGHGISGRSTNHGGIVIDLSRMNRIDVLDTSHRRVRLEPGAKWMDVAAALTPYGWGLSSGDYGGVGVGGLATAGGIGWLSRKHGLTIDHLKVVDIVLADGSLIRASKDEHPDLFWAVRGAGANFGIVTAFEFEVYEVGNIGFGQFVVDAGDTSGFLQKWGAAVEASPRDLTSFLIMGPPRPGQPIVAQIMSVVASDDPDTIVDRLQPIAGTGSLYGQQAVIMPYAALMANARGSHHDASGEPTVRSGLIEHLTPEFTAAAEQLIRSGATYFFQIRSVGGAVADVPPQETAYANRSANFSVIAFGPDRDRLNAEWQNLEPYFNGLYLSFETDQHPDSLSEAFPGETLVRLRELKMRYDPENLFRDNFSVAER